MGREDRAGVKDGRDGDEMCCFLRERQSRTELRGRLGLQAIGNMIGSWHGHMEPRGDGESGRKLCRMGLLILAGPRRPDRTLCQLTGVCWEWILGASRTE